MVSPSLLFVHTILSFTPESQVFTTLEKKASENIVGKGENAGNQHFLLFQQCFPTFPNKSPFFCSPFCHLQNAFKLDWSIILLFGKDMLNSQCAVTIINFYSLQGNKSHAIFV